MRYNGREQDDWYDDGDLIGVMYAEPDDFDTSLDPPAGFELNDFDAIAEDETADLNDLASFALDLIEDDALDAPPLIALMARVLGWSDDAARRLLDALLIEREEAGSW